MNSQNPPRQDVGRSKWICLTLSYCLLFSPIAGCSRNTDDAAGTGGKTKNHDPEALVEQTGNSHAGAEEPTFTDSAGAMLESTWEVITETTESGLTIVSEKCAAGSEMVVDASRAAWIWSTDKTAKGWEWIVANAGEATEWAKDTASNTWTVMKDKSGEFSLWVRVEAEHGIAWARTTIPAAWKVTKDTAGRAIVWIDEHKVELAVAAAVVTVVVAGLIVVPEGVAPAVVKGAVAGTMAETTRFLTAVWNGRNSTDQKQALQDVSHDMFMSIGKSVLSQCGSQVLGSVTAPAA